MQEFMVWVSSLTFTQLLVWPAVALPLLAIVSWKNRKKR